MFGTNFGNNASSGGVSYTPEAIAYFDAARRRWRYINRYNSKRMLYNQLL